MTHADISHTAPVDSVGLDAGWLAVMGHHYLNDVSAAVGSMSTVQMRWSALDLGEVEQLLVPAITRLERVAAFLTQIVRSAGLADGISDA